VEREPMSILVEFGLVALGVLSGLTVLTWVGSRRQARFAREGK
jgi:hypothetical protein